MRADALSSWLHELTDWQVDVRCPLEQSHGVYRFGVELYNQLQRRAPVLHHAYFNFLELAGLHRHERAILGAEKFRGVLQSFRPDLIVSTHAHLNHGFFEISRRCLAPHRVRCVIYCGELGGGYGFSRHWVNPRADLFIAAVPETRAAAIQHGMPPARARVGGFLLRTSFYDEPSPDRVRAFVEQELKLDSNEPILLLATGARGANNHYRLLRSLERRGKPAQVVALCGGNSGVIQQLRAWGSNVSGVELRALAYREDMPLLLRAATAVVARPGTGTSSEAIQTGCPLLMNGLGGVMPQERITVRYVLEHGLGRLIRRPADLAELLDDWERSPADYTTLRASIQAARPSIDPRTIVGHLAEQV